MNAEAKASWCVCPWEKIVSMRRAVVGRRAHCNSDVDVEVRVY